jgi:nucleoside-diphosphate-sugar epimerase
MKVLVTGGGGFLGSAIVSLLARRGDQAVSLSRRRYPRLDSLGVEQIQGDIADPHAVEHAMRGCDLVFHVAAKAGVWGKYEEYHQANVTGTENVLSCCQQLQVRQLVYTSSPSVVFTGKDMEGVDESVPYAEHFEAHYPRTKAMAERLVLEANGPELATVALRPHLIWGPEDNHLVPRILARGRAGRLRRIGRANKLIDSIYIDNAADAHLLAADRLAPGSPIAGKAYFLTNDEPRPVWHLINAILAADDIPPVTRRVPYWFAYAAGWLMEKTYGWLHRKGEPPMTRFLARELATAHWFNIRAAREDLGYEPRVSIEEGLARLREWCLASRAGGGRGGEGEKGRRGDKTADG